MHWAAAKSRQLSGRLHSREVENEKTVDWRTEKGQATHFQYIKRYEVLKENK